MLKKDDNNQMVLNNHKRILLVSDGKVKNNGVIDKQKSSNIHIDSYKYDVHDFFGDLRGTNRSSQLHLASLMLSINNDMPIKEIEMTPIQFAMYILQTCLTNRPLS